MSSETRMRYRSAVALRRDGAVQREGWVVRREGKEREGGG